MAWARSETSILNHRKFVGLDPAAVGLWTMGNAYCMDQLTDGLIPRVQLPRLIFAKPQRCVALAEALVKAGLWEHDGDDYRVHDYLDWNPSRAQIRADREAARARMKQHRRSGERTPERSEEQRGERSQVRSGEVRQSVHDKQRSSREVTTPPTPQGERSGEQKPVRHDYPPGMSTEDKLATGWLPGRWPYAAFRHDCPEPHWRGHCARPDFDGPKPPIKQCPAHRQDAE